VTDSRSTRALFWTGPFFAVVFYIVVFVVQGSTPGEKDSAAKVMAYYNSHQGRTLLSVFISPLGGALIVLFFSQLAALARERGVGGAGPIVLVSGAVLWAAGLLLGAGVELGLETSSDHAQPQVAQTLNVFNVNDWVLFVGGIAVMLIGAALTVLASDILPHWLGRVALVAGVVSLIGPGGFLGFFLGPLFMLVAGVMLATRSSSDAPAVPA
jgi:hypothetical protein